MREYWVGPDGGCARVNVSALFAEHVGERGTCVPGARREREPRGRRFHTDTRRRRSSLHRRVRVVECDRRGFARRRHFGARLCLSIVANGHVTAIVRCMHNVAFIADLMRSGAALSAISAEQRLSYVPFTY